jgi:hypothetical protein
MNKKILISKELLSKEVKKIKKISGINHTVIIEQVILGLGYTSYQEYVNTIKNKDNQKKDRSLCCLSNLNIQELSEIQQQIIKKIKGIQLPEIPFIQKELNKKIDTYKNNGIGYFFYIDLYLYNTIYKFHDSFIDINLTLNEEEIIKYILHVSTRYKNHKLTQNKFNYFLKNKECTKEELTLLKELDLYELTKFLKEKQINNNSEDFILPLIYDFIYENNSIDNFIIKIKERIILENKYLKSLKIDSISIPVLQHNKSEEQNIPKEIFEYTNSSQPILLGIRKEERLFKNETIPLTLKNSEINENIYCEGSSGSGYSLFSMHYLSQLVLNNNSGYINFDLLGDPTQYFRNIEHLRNVRPNENLIYFTLNNIDTISKEMLKSFVINQKKVHIRVDFLAKSTKEYKNKVEKSILNLLEDLSEINNINNAFFINLLNTNYFSEDFYIKLKNNILKLNKKNYSFIVTDWGLCSINKARTELIDVLQHKILLRTEDYNAFYYFGVNKEAYDLLAGEFVYFKNKEPTEHIYKLPYMNVYSQQETYLTLPNEFK